MRRYHFLCGMLLSALWLAPFAHAQEGVGISEIYAPPEARNWSERTRLLENAALIEIQVVVSVKGSPDRLMELTSTRSATVGCVISHTGSCSPLHDLGLVDIPVGRLLDLLVANVPHIASSDSADPPRSFLMHPSTQVKYSDWSFNPEAGMKMPGEITVIQNRKVILFQTERFLLIRGGVPIR